LKIDPRTRTIQGTVALQFIVTRTVRQLKMKLQQPLQVTTATLDQKPIPFSHHGSNLIFPLAPAFIAGSTHVITIIYNGTPSPEAARSGGMRFDTHSGIASATTLSEPFGSDNWWPCMDDVSDKLTADITLTVPPDMFGASNGRLMDTTTTPDGWNVYHWRENYPLANYLISANVTNYASFSSSYTSLDQKSKMPIVYYVYPENL